MDRKKEPLYRKVNKKALNFHQNNPGGEFRYKRHIKEFKNFEGNHMSMGKKEQRGLDYTPLFRFLLSKVGHSWDEVYSEAVSRLDRTQPIFWMVALHEHEMTDRCSVGEGSFWSKLFVDKDGILRKVNENYTINDIKKTCNCCTFSFNGVPLPSHIKYKYE